MGVGPGEGVGGTELDRDYGGSSRGASSRRCDKQYSFWDTTTLGCKKLSNHEFCCDRADSRHDTGPGREWSTFGGGKRVRETASGCLCRTSYIARVMKKLQSQRPPRQYQYTFLFQMTRPHHTCTYRSATRGEKNIATFLYLYLPLFHTAIAIL